MNVLIVDDEERFAASVVQGLKAEGFAVDVAHDGPVGLAMAAATNTTPSCWTSCSQASTGTRRIRSCGQRATGRRSLFRLRWTTSWMRPRDLTAALTIT